MKKAVIFLPSIQHGGIQRSLLEALSVVDKTKYDIISPRQEGMRLFWHLSDRMEVLIMKDFAVILFFILMIIIYIKK